MRYRAPNFGVAQDTAEMLKSDLEGRAWNSPDEMPPPDSVSMR